MGVDVLLKGESCLLRFQTSLVRDLLKVLVFLFRRGSHSPTQLLHGLGERSVASLYSLTNRVFSSQITHL
jgi:hypothetical protein